MHCGNHPTGKPLHVSFVHDRQRYVKRGGGSPPLEWGKISIDFKQLQKTWMIRKDYLLDGLVIPTSYHFTGKPTQR